MHLCRLLVELLVVVGLCSMHCSLHFIFTFKHQCEFNLPQWVKEEFEKQTNKQNHSIYLQKIRRGIQTDLGL